LGSWSLQGCGIDPGRNQLLAERAAMPLGLLLKQKGDGGKSLVGAPLEVIAGHVGVVDGEDEQLHGNRVR